MSNEYPKMLYKKGSEHTLNEGSVDTLIVEDATFETAAIAEGWFVTVAEVFAEPQVTLDLKPAPEAPKVEAPVQDAANAWAAPVAPTDKGV